MTFSEKQLEPPKKGEVDIAVELRLYDKSKLDPRNILTSDQALFEIANIKENINKTLLRSIKEASIDCIIHQKSGSDKLKCFSFGNVDPNKFSYNPSLKDEEEDTMTTSNQVEVKLKLKKVIIQGKEYALDIGKIVKKNEDENGIIITEVYDAGSVENENPLPIGRLQFKDLIPIMPLLPL